MSRNFGVAQRYREPVRIDWPKLGVWLVLAMFCAWAWWMVFVVGYAIWNAVFE